MYKAYILAGLVSVTAFNGRPIRDLRIQVIGTSDSYGPACTTARWTGWQNVSYAGNVHIQIDFDDSDADGTTTAVNMTCQSYVDNTPAMDGGRDVHGLDGGVFAGGMLTLNSGPAIFVNPLVAVADNDESWTWTIYNLPDNYLACKFTCTNADAGDKLRVYFMYESP